MKSLVSLLCKVRSLAHLPLSLSVTSVSPVFVYIVNAGGIYMLGLTASLCGRWGGTAFILLDLEMPDYKRLCSGIPNATFSSLIWL